MFEAHKKWCIKSRGEGECLSDIIACIHVQNHLKHHKSNTAQTMKVQIERNTTPAYDTVIWQSFPVLFYLCLIT